MLKLNPYLKFNDDKCREAMQFYKECIGGELTLQTVAESPIAKEMPPEGQNKIMHAMLKSGEHFELFASDMMRDKAVVGDNIGASINLDDEAQARDIFAKLSVGGDVFMPMEKVFWGDLFGVVTDKYGIEWMVNYSMKA